MEKEIINVNRHQSPFVVIWEMTRACSLKCLHCQLKTQIEKEPDDLTFEEGMRLMDEITELDNPLLILTGGDVFTRTDFFDLVQYGLNKGLKVVIAASATHNVTNDVIKRAHDIGVSRWAFTLDGPDRHSHDALCGVPGTFDLTLSLLRFIKEMGLSAEINSVVSKINYDRIEEMGKLVKDLGVALWNIIMMVPTPGNQEITPLTASEHELFFQWLYDYSRKAPFKVKTIYGQHYQRVVIQNKMRQLHINYNGLEYQNALREGPAGVQQLLNYNPQGLNDGNGTLYISHNGDVYPSQIMPIKAGNVKDELLKVIYRYSPLFKKLKNPDLLKGKCGICEFRYVCGGNRSRAYNLTGDYLESEPYCIYTPKKAYHLREKVLVK
ncbi:TIGR04053 family radical SAM/SPASM domain-containing protein [Bacillus benzoevorans]|uniref:Radical SAM protein n=1 Tax=Bacillus benzoevorans TaxID=1456 RepID=A0A7X0HUW8_9BACI|nr:TIGR04053 family radical SAM/SPASM domain-containing protein [Bacillus benzoevorans]MBB6446016.1 radical SAM protein [Bacillus benzoevorans]